MYQKLGQPKINIPHNRVNKMTRQLLNYLRNKLSFRSLSALPTADYGRVLLEH